jgi:hypothetical protein
MPELPAICPQAGRLTWPQCHGVAGIGIDWGKANQQQRGKGDETTAPGDRIDGPGDQGRDKEKDSVVNVH